MIESHSKLQSLPATRTSMGYTRGFCNLESATEGKSHDGELAVCACCQGLLLQEGWNDEDMGGDEQGRGGLLLLPYYVSHNVG